MKFQKKAALRMLLYVTGLWLAIYSLWELRPHSTDDYSMFISVFATGCLIVLGTFAQARSEHYRRRVPGKGVLHPNLASAQPEFIEPMLGPVSMINFVRRRP